MSVFNAARSALLIIDVQESFRHRPYWSEADLPAFKEAVLRLERGAREHGVPVIHVFHIDQDAAFTKESGFVTALDWVPGGPDVVFEKHTHNAFTDTGLDLWLRRRGINHLVITGIRTEQCCETTTRVASDIGYAVDYVTEATLTFPMTHAGSGRVYSPEEIKARTELVLAGRFARIASVDDALAGWQSQRAA
ncbi:isochorismatase family protein [Paraburkholderia phenazinium]|jgi:nicotinamidase-related amidase|uniref:Nicotinamidase-related amidase n=1 Tax=Paraburkholderia phenazinium TaxID=60549 RepID=A0A1G7S1E0_9BURK|nr:isochorismatase family protein [Paraburkholderia phenazinium]SDG16833.1 Nicotinamidase-related amidase [Paraburkholderia phenazinium]